MQLSSRSILPFLAAAALALSACGGEAEVPPTPATEAASTTTPEPVPEPTDEAPATGSDDGAIEMEEEMEEIAASMEAQQTGGSASVTIGDQTWDFDGVLCAFGPEEIGQEGAEFVLSAIGDGLQFYISVDAMGQFVSLNDIENFEDPALSWEADQDASGEGFIQVDGKDVSGEATFIDYLSESWDEVEGSFEGSCP
ncbi:hypothetical protein [Tessaracoccus flavus]|uniref:Uncharacterized protein n=1 Tax=Tessaracoccus flavus TaxID=1610493 RepID=A0A1Q2CBQ4_9ACTN|nr:hypothetical protein [Tessaracoccus flavus]AQP43543.1 hypothetical protein RPIT_00840 [Tessaracoccus flavus]SDY86634.1 hypothetical protein SAMN05428934_105121 [Tessaracoccus flavus]